MATSIVAHPAVYPASRWRNHPHAQAAIHYGRTLLDLIGPEKLAWKLQQAGLSAAEVDDYIDVLEDVQVQS